jgi:membrane fusion protein (multidrug efflux system)
VVEQKGEKVAAFVPVQLGLREKGLVEIRAISPAVLTDKQTIVASGVGSLILYPGIKLEPRPLRAEFRIED